MYAKAVASSFLFSSALILHIQTSQALPCCRLESITTAAKPTRGMLLSLAGFIDKSPFPFKAVALREILLVGWRQREKKRTKEVDERSVDPSVTLKITNGQSTSQWKSNYNLLLLVFLSILPPPHPPLSVCTSPLKQWRNPALLSLAFPPRDLQWKEAKRAKLLRLEAATIRCWTCPAEE